MSGKYLTFVIALATALIALGLLPGARAYGRYSSLHNVFRR
jgi:hypothetical protein